MSQPARKPKKTATQSPVSRTEGSGTPGTIEELRAYYHSVHDSERADVIALLGSMADPNAARELISLFSECEWRSTKLQIIRAISQNPGNRGLEFLFRLAQEKQDIPIAEAAVWALGQTHHVLAARFLVSFYADCGEFLKPTVVGALGQLPDRRLAREFVEELPRALKANQSALVKNLVLTLGELKVREALPLLESLASDRLQPAIALSALVSIGKISRDPKALDGLERRFQNDLFEYQLFTSAKTQVQFRSQWKLEDYLTRIFETSTFHRSLPFELSHFKAEDVREGLKLFKGEKHLESLCLALSKLDFPGIAAWYAELIDFAALDATGMRHVLASISAHCDAEFGGPLTALAGHPACAAGDGLAAWLQAVSMALPDADAELKEFFGSERYRLLGETQKITALNHLIDYGLCLQTQGAHLHSVARILEKVLETEPEGAANVQARALRGLAHLRFASKKAQTFAREGFGDPKIAASALRYFELVPDKSLFEASIPAGLELSALRGFTAQPSLPESDGRIDALLRSSLGAQQSEQRLEALRLLSRHPRKAFLPEILKAVQNEDTRTSLAAIIALRSHAAFADDSAAELLGPLLRSPQQSIAGRALDTLTTLPGLRAKRVVIDFLRERETDGDVCDKIVRCLAAPPTGADYFVNVIDGILKRHPEHPQLDGLVALRERITEAGAPAHALAQAIKGADITAIDRALTQRISAYEELDESVRSALRSAELPYLHPQMFDDYVDKSASLVEYCKAVDIQLEKTLGKRHLFTKLENHLHEFQSALHAASLGEDFPSADRVIKQMGLEKHFTAQSLPLHKMITVAQGIRTGRIVNERFKTLDGLRAWAVILLVFARKFQGGKPLIAMREATDDQVAAFCKRLIALQEVRNPAAHRQTVSKLALLDETRAEALALLNQIQRMF